MRRRFLDKDEAERYYRRFCSDPENMARLRRSEDRLGLNSTSNRNFISILARNHVAKQSNGLGQVKRRVLPWKQYRIRFFFLRSGGIATPRRAREARRIIEAANDALRPGKLVFRSGPPVDPFEVRQFREFSRDTLNLTHDRARLFRGAMGSARLAGRGTINAVLLNGLRGAHAQTFLQSNIVWIAESAFTTSPLQAHGALIHEVLHLAGGPGLQHNEGGENPMDITETGRNELTARQIQMLRGAAVDWEAPERI